MGHRLFGNIPAYIYLGLVVLLVFTTHSSNASPQVELTLTLNGGQQFTISFQQWDFKSLVACLCNDQQSTCSFHTNYEYALKELLPTTINSEPGDLSNWRITISKKQYYHYYYGLRWYIQYKLTKRNSKVSDLTCWNEVYYYPQVWRGNPMCSFKPQRVYLGGSRWLVIDDAVDVVTYKYNYYDPKCNVGCMDDCGTTPTTLTTPTPPPVDSTESLVNITGNNTDIFIGNITNIIMGNETETTGTASPQTESSSDQTPVIVGVVIAVLIVLILVVILAVILWRRKRSKQAEANPTFAASNPGAYADAEFVHSGNAQSHATEGGDSQSVPRLPPPYSEVERNPQFGFTNDGYGVSGDVQI